MMKKISACTVLALVWLLVVALLPKSADWQELSKGFKLIYKTDGLFMSTTEVTNLQY